MSLLRSCQQAVRQQTAARAAFAAARAYATDSNIPQTTEHKQDTAITETPQRDVVAADIVSGAPKELRHRVVRIFQPTRSTTQSGSGKSHRWRIDWDTLPGAGRWENPLMGWASSADYMQGTRLSFRTKEDAIHFAEKQGWDYYIAATEIKRIPPKNYAENFLYKPNKLRLIRTK
ncbi:hypothetical protein PYCCODRAFT_1435407 [Trametes coccinea BRFM310]|uniref:NADH dehydrogenase [ubiquinone] iron-sulfur protein 4, mitochondrial n=1 Tax=Trametes coccinea (strain BRFM310) TaxID=1353009 RepID=A0A1Y2IMS5_TRAC3|nr:hypothetical protein PYCCODRAFT_1435407 [Trametes coccinea BRFM310]